MNKKIIYLWLVVFLMGFLFNLIVCGASNLEIKDFKDRRLEALAYERITLTGEDRTISKIKSVYDFSGNEYKVIELLPIGYMIYSVDSGIFVERGINSPSPYLNYEKDLYYGGPKNYYILQEDKFVHTVIDTQLDIASLKSYQEVTDKMYQALQEKKDTAVLQYVNSGKKISTIQSTSVTIQAASLSGSIAHPEFFVNLDSYGHYSGQVCGYIALNMAIAYHDKYKNIGSDDIMDDIYWTNSQKNGLKNGNNSLTKVLFELDPHIGVNSTIIKGVMEKYAKTRGLVYKHTSRVKPFYTIETVMNAIDSDCPVLAFGDFTNPLEGGIVPHVAVIYSYVAYKLLGIVYDADYTVHFGWLGFNDIVLSGFIANIYFFDNV